MSAARERPIQVSGPMVRAILDGTKTQTRRVVKPQPWQCQRLARDPASPSGYSLIADAYEDQMLVCPYGVPGDRLWVREAFTYWEQPDRDDSVRANESHRPQDGKRYQRWMDRIMADETSSVEDFLLYKADDAKRSLAEWPYPHPIYDHCIGRFGKTVSSRFMPRWASRITLEITDVRVQRVQDIGEEDAHDEGAPAWTGAMQSYRTGFHCLWDGINAKRGFAWTLNPWVWALTFRRVAP